MPRLEPVEEKNTTDVIHCLLMTAAQRSDVTRPYCANKHNTGLGLCENSSAVSMFGEVGQSQVAG